MLSFSAFCALGCLLRYGSEWSISRVLGLKRLWGTLAVNGLGCFVAGLLLSRSGQSSAWILPFCGGLTSFSAAFAGPIQTWVEGSRRTGVMVLCLTPFVCVLACVAGSTLSSSVM